MCKSFDLISRSPSLKCKDLFSPLGTSLTSALLFLSFSWSIKFFVNLLYCTASILVYSTIYMWGLNLLSWPLDTFLGMFYFLCMSSQSFVPIFSLLSATQLPTNCLYFLLEFLIYKRTTWYSVRQTFELMVMKCCSASSTILIKLLFKISTLEQLWLVSGTTLVFAATILIDLDSYVYVAEN